jgi:hypothetical protein
MKETARPRLRFSLRKIMLWTAAVAASVLAPPHFVVYALDGLLICVGLYLLLRILRNLMMV